jgi:hypothetical protein
MRKCNDFFGASRERADEQNSTDSCMQKVG